MNKFQPARVLGVLGIAVSSLAFAQNYQTMPIASGLNADVIANGVGPSMASTSTDVDGVHLPLYQEIFNLPLQAQRLRTVCL